MRTLVLAVAIVALGLYSHDADARRRSGPSGTEESLLKVADTPFTGPQNRVTGTLQTHHDANGIVSAILA